MDAFIITSAYQRTAAQQGHITPEYAEMITAALDDQPTELRSSVACDELGQSVTSLTVHRVDTPLGTLFTVTLTTTDGTEVTAYTLQQHAETAYEQEVRSLAATSGAPAWDDSDISGVALAPFTAEIYLLAQASDPSGPDQTRKLKLGTRLDDGDQEEPSTLEEAAATLLATAVTAQIAQNRWAALHEAVGSVDAPSAAFHVRVEVDGTTEDGPAVVVVDEAIAPYTPTPAEVEEFRQILLQVEDFDAEADGYDYWDVA